MRRWSGSTASEAGTSEMAQYVKRGAHPMRPPGPGPRQTPCMVATLCAGHPIERVEIPLEGNYLQGVLHMVPGASPHYS